MKIRLPDPWPFDEDLNALAKRADKLFIFASTAVRFISNKIVNNPQKQLKALLSSSPGLTKLSELDKLYLSILQPLIDEDSEDVFETFHTVVGSLLVLRADLSLHDLDQLLGYDSGQARSTLVPLQSFVIIPPSDSESASFYHPSFYDFLTSKGRCPEPKLRIDVKKLDQHVAIQCLKTMNTDLDFEGLSQNKPVPNLVDRITPHLHYSCVYWANHLSYSDRGSIEISLLLEEFLCTHLLRWFEVLSVKEQIPVAVTIIQSAKKWAVSTISTCKASSHGCSLDSHILVVLRKLSICYTTLIGLHYPFVTLCQQAQNTYTNLHYYFVLSRRRSGNSMGVACLIPSHLSKANLNDGRHV